MVIIALRQRTAPHTARRVSDAVGEEERQGTALVGKSLHRGSRGNALIAPRRFTASRAGPQKDLGYTPGRLLSAEANPLGSWRPEGVAKSVVRARGGEEGRTGAERSASFRVHLRNPRPRRSPETPLPLRAPNYTRNARNGIHTHSGLLLTSYASS